MSPAEEITITTNLRDAPNYAEKLGHLCVAWGNLEWHMYLRFEQMSGAPKPISRAAFHAIDSNRGRREMLLAVGKAVLQNAADISVLEDILRRIGRTSGSRNKYVHDTWCVASTEKKEVFQLRLGTGDGKRDMDAVAINDLEATTDSIQKLAEELHAFADRIAPSLPASLEKLRSLPGLPLVFAPKGHNPGKLPKGHRGQPPPSKG